ncbi:hypothetical protein ARMGADRAFT_1039610 [Armillaria gallica]|uniref:Uncharacterized protein n=1 Tax=Armillaria gallica TaxID=47427 RepID=A0A2H3CD72_ARMGA|nr:hypothetical protein ARMGADRAFT_1039610 [Armillaria gallica]
MDAEYFCSRGEWSWTSAPNPRPSFARRNIMRIPSAEESGRLGERSDGRDILCNKNRISARDKSRVANLFQQDIIFYPITDNLDLLHNSIKKVQGYRLPDNTAATNISYLVQQTIKQKLGYGETANHGMLKVQVPISEILFVFILDLTSSWRFPLVSLHRVLVSSVRL